MEISEIEPLGEQIKAAGGVAFCRGVIDALEGETYSAPTLEDFSDYARGYFSVATREQMLWVVSRRFPDHSYEGCRDSDMRRDLLAFVAPVDDEPAG